MRIVLERNLDFERKEIVSRMRLVQSRPDLQKILGMDLNRLPERLTDYLRKLQLLDAYGRLTALGERFRSEGQIPAEEYGQYEIWYLTADPWFGTRPVALRRIKAGKNSDQKGGKWRDRADYDEIWNIENHDEEYPMQEPDTGNLTWLHSLSIKAIRKTHLEQATGTLRCETENVDESSIQCEISGSLYWSTKGRNSDNLKILSSYSKTVKCLLSDVLGAEYDPIRNALISNSVPDDPQELTSFVRGSFEKKDVASNKHGTFSRISIEGISLRASNPAVAREWLMKLMQHSWATRYVSREQVELEQQAWLQSPALSDMGLSPSSGEELLNTLGRESGRAYWNIAAMHDLVPTGIKAKMPFDLSIGEHAVDQIIYRHLFDRREVRKVIISDPFVKPESLPILKRILPKNIPVEIYSYKYDLQNHLPPNWVHKNLQKGDTHDRIWLIHSGKQWECWNFSTSADQFSEKDGVIFMNKRMTIAPIVKLPQYLQDIVDIQTTGGIF